MASLAIYEFLPKKLCLSRNLTPQNHTIKSHLSPSSIRFFSTSPRWNLRVSEFSSSDFNSLKVNQNRLMDTIHHTCQWGTGQRWGDTPTETGMKRLALTDSDKSARDWFVSETQSLGCKTTIDAMGNIFAVRPGLNNDAPPTYAGSHLDTQPSGGRYDGILGIVAGLEMLRVLNENWVETEYPVGVVNWTNEEGARFPISMVSSAVWAHQIPLEQAHNLKEVGSGTATQKSELQKIGYLGSTPAAHTSIPLSAHFELHIEQGPILETSSSLIGIVTGVQAYKWFTITVTGKDTHTGTTPFATRADAMLTASKMILQSHRIATKHGGLASTGILNLEPGSTNTVPGIVRFSLDIRSGKDEVVEAMEKEVREVFAKIARGENVDGLNDGCTDGKPCIVDITTDSDSKAVKFHEDCIGCVRDAAGGLFGEKTEELTRELASGAGHDSVNTSKVCPTSMIFVPSKDGVSHNPAEYTKPEDCATGAQVLLGAVLRYDRLRKDRGE
ncbi:amidase [Tothia fuscella]|uniref:Amidase n=1 Tax=Tothia fuscella TaxID=1048955 RepID=A0A9P4U004_9PEZI|nr:amidase [Tothia fuscella]